MSSDSENEKNIKDSRSSSAVTKMMEDLSANTAAAKAVVAISSSSAVAKMMEDLSANTAAARAATAMTSSSTVAKALGAISTSIAIGEMLSSFSSPTIVEDLLSILTSDVSIYDDPFDRVSIDEAFEENLECTNYELEQVKDTNSFLAAIKKAPPLVQSILLFILLQIFLPNLNSITANLLTPQIKSYLTESKASKREKINHIKKVPSLSRELDTSNLRFISGEDVHLRKGPSIKSEILDLTNLGQVVTVLSKKRNWIEVEYTYESGEILHGWVFTRHTAKFIQYFRQQGAQY